MARKIIGANEEEARLLRELMDWWRGSDLRRPIIKAPETVITQAPDVYVVRTPAGGIPAITVDPGVGILDTPGSAICEVYRLLEDTPNKRIHPSGFNIRVYNHSMCTIPGWTWITAFRDKYGTWWAVHRDCDLIDTGTGTGTETGGGVPIVESSIINSFLINSTTQTIDKPTGTEEGDLLVVAISVVGNTFGSTTTPPAGWTNMQQGNISGAEGYWVGYKTAGASEPASYSFTYANDVTAAMIIARISGAGVPLFEGTSENTGTGTTMTMSSVTPLGPNRLLLFTGHQRALAAPAGPPTGMTSVHVDPNNYCQMFRENITPASATGTRDCTLSASVAWGAVGILVPPG